MADTTIPTRPDGLLLHFLKELPAWCVLALFVAAFLGVWNYSHDDFIPRIIDGLIGALLLSMQRAKAPTDLNVDTVKTRAITDSTVNATNLNVEKNKGDN